MYSDEMSKCFVFIIKEADLCEARANDLNTTIQKTDCKSRCLRDKYKKNDISPFSKF
jgi:hypothetical protein